jgi:hypothetical protein
VTVGLANLNSVDQGNAMGAFRMGFKDGACHRVARTGFESNPVLLPAYTEGYEAGVRARSLAEKAFGEKIGYDFATAILR